MSGHYSPLKSSQEFLESRHKLPTIPTPKPAPLTHGSWMKKPNYAASSIVYSANSSSPWCNPTSQSEKADVRVPNNVFQSQSDPSTGSHMPHLARSIIESSKTASVNGDITNVLPVNGSAKSKPTTIEQVAAAVAKTATTPNSLTKSNNIVEIVPPDEVESALETMFESDTKILPAIPTSVGLVATGTCKPTLDLIGESVEKILASPSPAKVEDTFPEAVDKMTKDDTVPTTNECDEDSLADCAVGKKPNTPNKKNEQSPHSNGRTPKSKLELALTRNSEKCDKSKNNHSLNKTSPRGEAKKVNSNEETYVEVESELAKMFAGIEDSETANKFSSRTTATPSVSDKNTVSANSLPNNSNDSTQSSLQVPSGEQSSSSNNFAAPKSKKTSRKKRANKPKNSASASSIKNTKTKHSSGKENSSFDSVTTKRVPVIHIEGSKENPISVQIINSIKTEEEESSDSKTAAKRKFGKNDRPLKRSATDYVPKNYDPSSSDSSWICAFCKLCAHFIDETGEPSGELFGPYFIRDPDKGAHDQHPVGEHAHKKQKRSISRGSECVDTSVSEEKSLEVWAHENCFIWAPGVHLLGSKLMGLEEAVWDALKTKCVRCGENGANIGCRVRKCKSFTHYGCAVLSGWKLDVEKFLSICNLHSLEQICRSTAQYDTSSNLSK